MLLAILFSCDIWQNGLLALGCVCCSLPPSLRPDLGPQLVPLHRPSRRPAPRQMGRRPRHAFLDRFRRRYEHRASSFVLPVVGAHPDLVAGPRQLARRVCLDRLYLGRRFHLPLHRTRHQLGGQTSPSLCTFARCSLGSEGVLTMPRSFFYRFPSFWEQRWCLYRSLRVSGGGTFGIRGRRERSACRRTTRWKSLCKSPGEGCWNLRQDSFIVELLLCFIRRIAFYGVLRERGPCEPEEFCFARCAGPRRLSQLPSHNSKMVVRSHPSSHRRPRLTPSRFAEDQSPPPLSRRAPPQLVHLDRSHLSQPRPRSAPFRPAARVHPCARSSQARADVQQAVRRFSRRARRRTVLHGEGREWGVGASGEWEWGWGGTGVGFGRSEECVGRRGGA